MRLRSRRCANDAAPNGTISFPLFNKPSVTLYELNAWEVRWRYRRAADPTVRQLDGPCEGIHACVAA